MNVLFWGTPDFAVPSLRAIDDEGFVVVGVVTQPDRPSGRGRRITPSPVKRVALEMGLPVLTPDRPRGDAFVDEIRALEPDLSVVVAYGHILRPEVLALPAGGSINLHASLLPELRGAAPIPWAIERGHEETGVTIMRMVEAMDAGPVILQVAEPIMADQSASEVTQRLSELGAEVLVEALTLLAGGVATEVEQDHDAATYAPKIDRETARIDWGRDAASVARHIRAMDAVPGAWTTLDGMPTKLFRARPLDGVDDPTPVPSPTGNGGQPAGGPSSPGTVLRADPEEGIVIAAAGGSVLVTEVQPPGKRRMRAADWVNGRGIEAGRRFE